MLRCVGAVTALLGVSAGEALADVQVLTNTGFESGGLSPWFIGRTFVAPTQSWSVTTASPHTGTFAATVNGNQELRQNFSAISAAAITDVAFFAALGQNGVLAFDFFYTDGTDNENLVASSGAGYQLFDVTANLDRTKILTGFSVFGNTSGAISFDDASITASVPSSVTSVPEPPTTALAGLALGLAWVARSARRRFTRRRG